MIGWSVITKFNSSIFNFHIYYIVSSKAPILAMNFFSTCSLISFLLPLSSITPSVHSVSNNNGGFTVDSFHRESPNPLTTTPPKHDLSASEARSTALSLECPLLDPLIPQTTSSNSEYLMKVAIGTPPAEECGIVDTGSDLTWFHNPLKKLMH